MLPLNPVLSCYIIKKFLWSLSLVSGKEALKPLFSLSPSDHTRVYVKKMIQDGGQSTKRPTL